MQLPKYLLYNTDPSDDDSSSDESISVPAKRARADTYGASSTTSHGSGKYKNHKYMVQHNTGNKFYLACCLFYLFTSQILNNVISYYTYSVIIHQAHKAYITLNYKDFMSQGKRKSHASMSNNYCHSIVKSNRQIIAITCNKMYAWQGSKFQYAKFTRKLFVDPNDKAHICLQTICVKFEL